MGQQKFLAIWPSLFFLYKEAILTAQSNDIFYLHLSEKQGQHKHINIMNKK